MARSKKAPEAEKKAPAKKEKKEYIIRSGDTLTSISKRIGVSPEAIIKENGIISSASLYAGRKIFIFI